MRSLIDKGGAPNAQWTARTKELHDLYVNERKSMAMNAAGRGAATATYQARQAACPAPAAETSGSERPRLAQAPESLKQFYPPKLIRREVEGTVVVSLKIDTSGCPTDFAIAASSGDASFDSAALPLAVVFKLTD